MRGQFTIEFTLAAVSFVILIVYAMTFVNKEVPLFTSQHELDEIKARAFQISEFLIFDDGEWDNDPSDPARIGLSNGYHIVNKTKMQYLDNLCSTEEGYKKILSLLNINTHLTANEYTGFRSFLLSENRCVSISAYSSSSNLIRCPPESGTDTWECINTLVEQVTQQYQIVRYSPSEDRDTINITVGVW